MKYGCSVCKCSHADDVDTSVGEKTLREWISAQDILDAQEKRIKALEDALKELQSK